MPLITVIIILAAVGLIVWLVTTYLPMSPPVKKMIVVVAVIVLILWLLQLFGVFDSLTAVRVGHPMR